MCGAARTFMPYKDPEKRKQVVRDSMRKHGRKYRARNPERRRADQLRLKFGITPEEYDDLLLEQEGVCAICRGDDPAGRRLAVDHDHETGRVRGLLCTNCNLVLGHAKDDPARLRAALDYLEL